MGLAECNAKINHQGRELTEHGTALFPAACYHDDLRRESVPWHWHDEMEAVIVTEGRAVIDVGAERYTLGAGAGFYINAGVLHAAWAAEPGECRFHSIVFHPRLVGGGIDSVFWQKYIQPLAENPSMKIVCFAGAEPWNQEAAGVIEEAWQSCVAELPGYEFEVRGALSRLIFLLSGHSSAVHSHPSEKVLRDGARIKTMLQYVQEHYDEELNTAQIAQSAMISESECLRCFRGTIGTTPIQYVKQFRIQKAAELLVATGEKIADIAAKCGFQEMSYFAKAFREQKGCTPTEYRRKKAPLQ